VIGTCFVHCGLWGPFTRLHGCESRAQVMVFLQEVRSKHPSLTHVGYDAFCLLEKSLAKHRPHDLETLKGFHDRWHMRNHTRDRCHTELSADVHSALWQWDLVTCTTHQDLQRELRTVGRGSAHIHRIYGHDDVSLPVAVLRATARATHLPATFTFMTTSTTPPSLHPVHIATDQGLASLLCLVDKTTGRLRGDVRRSLWRAPLGAYLHSIKQDSHPITELRSVPQSLLVREAFRRLGEGPVQVLLRKSRNTSRLERKWRALNRFRPSLVQMPPLRFDFHVLHIMSAHNQASLRTVCGGMASLSHTQVHDLMRNATHAVGRTWQAAAILGPLNAQDIGYAAVVANLHELPCTIAHMAAASARRVGHYLLQAMLLLQLSVSDLEPGHINRNQACQNSFERTI